MFFYDIWNINLFYFNSSRMTYFSFKIERELQTWCLPFDYYEVVDSSTVVHAGIPMAHNNLFKICKLRIRVIFSSK